MSKSKRSDSINNSFSSEHPFIAAFLQMREDITWIKKSCDEQINILRLEIKELADIVERGEKTPNLTIFPSTPQEET